MANAFDQGGYNKGRIDGFDKGRQDGFNKGLEDKKAMLLNPPLNEIGQKWRELHCADKLVSHYGSSVKLNDQNMECLKETFKSSIWKLEVFVKEQAFPIILKIFKSPIESQALIELNMYRKSSGILPDLMPAILLVEERVNNEDVWVFMEYVPQIKGQLIFTPDHFDKIIPSLAKLHAKTYNDRFHQHSDLFADWLPLYHSNTAAIERQKIRNQTFGYLDKAMSIPELKKRLDSSYNFLQRILQKGPEYFPELIQAGSSIIHNDLQTPNIGCSDVGAESWNIKFIDWEGARFAPCWFDMFNLLGVFFAYRKDWRNEEEAVIQRCAHLYSAEMLKHGILFNVDPVRLYKMAYLQRVLERSLYLQLQWATEGQKPAYLLEGYLDKINNWGVELGL